MGAVCFEYDRPVLLSLAQMIKADVEKLALALGQLHRCTGFCTGKTAIEGDLKKLVLDAFASAKVEFSKYDLLVAVSRLDRGVRWLSNINGYTLDNVKRDLEETIYCAEDQLGRVYFGSVDARKAQEILDADVLWAKTIGAFQSAARDAKEASYCYALSRNNASVHHCMMVLERGFDSLAHKLGFDPGARSWGTVIDDMEREIVDRQKKLKAAKPTDLLTFLSVAAKEFTYFKDAWRNHTAHGRAEYDENDARKVLTHTRDFMEHLATRLKDRKR